MAAALASPPRTWPRLAKPPPPRATPRPAGVEVAPPGLTTWSLDGITLGAPEGRVFALAIVRDVDGDGLKDAFAVVRRADASGPGDVIFYRGSALAAPVVFSPPQLLPFDPRCSAVVRLAPAGARSVLAELGESCSDHAPSGPDRWMAVIAVALAWRRALRRPGSVSRRRSPIRWARRSCPSTRRWPTATATASTTSR